MTWRNDVEDQYEDEADDDDDDESDDPEHHPEGPDPSEMDSSDDPDLDVCPHCRKMIVEDAEQCPHCGQYISPGDAPLSRPWWIAIVILILLTMTGLIWIF